MRAFLIAALLWVPALSVAQTPPPSNAPAPNDLEPRAQTSETPPAPTATPTTPSPAAQATRPPAPNTTAPAARGRTNNSRDRLDLDATQITGNRELPKVLYIVPWRRSDLGDLGGRPVNSLLDEVLAPVDRDVFKRQNRYYEALKPDEPRSGSESPARPER